eukprot:m.115539 g.115539  ORF g.115539 m.115539 type:complete len:650 (+) comp10882_c0_seq1:101-2050(+)
MGKSGKHRKRVKQLRERERVAAVDITAPTALSTMHAPAKSTMAVIQGGGERVGGGGQAQANGVQTARVSNGHALNGTHAHGSMGLTSAEGNTVAEEETDEGDNAVFPHVDVTRNELDITVRTLAALGAAKDVLRERQLKQLRSVLHPLLEELFAIRKAGALDSPAAAAATRKRGAPVPTLKDRTASAEEHLNESNRKKRLLSDSATTTTTNTLGQNSKRVNLALAGGDWITALATLREMRSAKQVPKLGTVQRWVRVCDAAVHDPVALQVLDGILRTCDPDQTAAASGGHFERGDARTADATGAGQPTLLAGTLVRHPAWHAAPPVQDDDDNDADEETRVTASGGGSGTRNDRDEDATYSYDSDAATVRDIKGHFQVIAHEKGSERHPPNKYDLLVLTTDSTVVDLSQPRPAHEPQPRRVDVPFVPQAFAMVDVLTRAECRNIIRVAEAVGYSPDEPISALNKGPTALGGDALLTAAEAEAAAAAHPRASALVWLANPALNDALFERCRHLLSPELGGGELCGLNARWRLYRYEEGAVYRPHVDGAWPGSGLVDSRLEYDAFGDRWSRLTFLVYLNDGFEGGHTTFFTPGPVEGTLHARGVTPRAGTILCFPHGDTAGSLVHEGSAVTSGKKYIIRTDVLYKKPNTAKD